VAVDAEEAAEGSSFSWLTPSHRRYIPEMPAMPELPDIDPTKEITEEEEAEFERLKQEAVDKMEAAIQVRQEGVDGRVDGVLYSHFSRRGRSGSSPLHPPASTSCCWTTY
jgi:hypothetical protein